MSRISIANTIVSLTDKLKVGSCSKDIRLQPITPITNEEFISIIQESNLSIVSTKQPGELGSTSSQLLTYIIQDINGTTHPLVLGKGKGFGTKDEDIVISGLKQELSNLLIDKQYINLEINNSVYRVNGIQSTKGTPKSDFEFTYNGDSVVFISHKAGTTAKHFQQYSGTSMRSGTRIHNHEEVMDFVNKIRDLYPSGIPKGVSVYRPIQCKELSRLAIFGKNYGEELGVDNVHCLVQGRISFKRRGDGLYTLTSFHISNNGELNLNEDYLPILMGRYNPSRGNNHNIKNLRTFIMPRAKISSSTEMI